MKLSENVETKTSEVKASNSRASRMARYSAAAAGVAAVSSIEVDAAMIKVIVTDANAQNTDSYELDLGAITTGAKLFLSHSYASFSATATKGHVALSSLSASYLNFFSPGSKIGSGEIWSSSAWSSMTSGAGLFGFRVTPGGGDYTYGWFKVTIDSSSAFTLNSYGYNSTLNAAATAGEGEVAGVPDSGPGIVGLALIGAGAAGVRLLRKLRAGK